MKKELRIKVIIDTENDTLDTLLEHKGFHPNKPMQNSLEIASILEILRLEEIQKISDTPKKE